MPDPKPPSPEALEAARGYLSALVSWPIAETPLAKILDAFAAQAVAPWQRPELSGWSIVGMNHYHQGGQRRLFVSMARFGQCITAEGADDADLWRRLSEMATAAVAERVQESAQTAQAVAAERERVEILIHMHLSDGQARGLLEDLRSGRQP